MANFFPNHKRGDTFNGKTIIVYDGTGVSKTPKDLTGVTVLMQFRPLGLRSVAFEFKSSDGTITIPAPLNGKILMMPRIINVKPIDYNFDVQLTFPGGKILTIFSSTWKITDDVSR